jgi:hypothetical protein
VLLSEVKAAAQLVSGNELRYFFAARSSQTISLPVAVGTDKLVWIDLDAVRTNRHTSFDLDRLMSLDEHGLRPMLVVDGRLMVALQPVAGTELRYRFPRPQEIHRVARGTAVGPARSLRRTARLWQFAKSGLPIGSGSVGKEGMMHQVKVGEARGLNTWAAFTGRDDLAAVDGYFIMTANEVQPVLHTLRKGGINIVALHNHMIGEQPAFFFLHFWVKGCTDDLAKGVKAALDAQANASRQAGTH